MCLVSIITPSHNSSQFISETITSVICQSFSEWEMIIVDDHSTDNTTEIISTFTKSDPRIKLIQLSENVGAAVARNKGIELARGRYISFLDSDDVWFSNKLKQQLDYIQQNKVAFSYSAYEKIDEAGKVLGKIGVPEKVEYNDLLKVCSIGCLTAIYDTHILGKVYMPLIRKRQDLGLWLKILKQNPFAYSTPGVLAQYRIRDNSISSNKKAAAQYTWKLYREVEGLNFFVAAFYFSHYAINGILRSKMPKLAKFLGVLKNT